MKAARFARRLNLLLGGDLSSWLFTPNPFSASVHLSCMLKHLMHQQVPEHHIYRVMAECLVLGRPLPVLCG